MRAVRTFRGRNVYVLCLLGIFALSVLVALSFLEFRSENRERIQAVNNAYLEEIARQSNLRISTRTEPSKSRPFPSGVNTRTSWKS